MEGLLLLARLALALVFVVAGVAKLADPASGRRALRDFGVPAPLAPLFAPLLPLLELAAALALLARSSAWWGAALALALLAGFAAAIGLNLARGHRPDCRCFGQLHSDPIGWSTLGRNLALATLAAFILWAGRVDPGPGPLDWAAGLGAGERIAAALGAAALLLLALEGWLLLQVIAQNGRLLLRVEALEARLGTDAPSPATASAAGPRPGVSAPAFALETLEGKTVALDDLRAAGKPILLLFVDPACDPCSALLPDAARWQHDHADRLAVAVVSRGAADANRERVARHGVAPVLLQRDREVAERYHARATPAAVLVQPDGTIGSQVALGADAIRALARDTLASGPPAPARHHHPPAVRGGDPAPPLRLPDLEGRMVDLAAFRGQPTLVLFWDPSCGFCRRMLPDLQRWDAGPPPGAPRLLVVSRGTVEANRTQGLRAPLLLDPDFTVGRAFGARGTPSAVLVDAQGRIASPVGSGASGVWALLERAPAPSR